MPFLRAAALVFAVGLPALAAAAPWAWSPEEQAYLDAKGPIRLCVDPNWPPLERVDASGRHVGIGADIVGLIADRGGLDVQLVRTASWSESLSKAQARECDMLSMASRSPEREKWLDFTTPYIEIPGVIVTRDNVHPIASFAQVVGRPLGIMRGFSSVQSLKAEHPEIQLIEVDSYREGFERVQSGELFGMLGNMASIGEALQDDSILDLKIAGWSGTVTRSSIATRNDEPELGRIVQKLVDSITAQEKREIMNRWLAVRFDTGFDTRLFWRTTAPIALALLVMVAWAVSLRRLNAKLRFANAQLADANRRDPLTGLHNRMHLDEQLPARLNLCARNGLPLVLAMIDIDHFKAVNDAHGHPVGDIALRWLARQLAAAFRREDDLVVRYGGEEFVVLLSGGSLEDGIAQLQAFRERIEATSFEAGGVSLTLTVSIGVHGVRPTAADTPESMVQSADSALYAAKHAGRNRLVRAGRAGGG